MADLSREEVSTGGTVDLPDDVWEAAVDDALTGWDNAIIVDHRAADLGRMRAALTAALPGVIAVVKAEAWDEGKNAAASDSAQIIGWGLRGTPGVACPEVSKNPYRKDNQ